MSKHKSKYHYKKYEYNSETARLNSATILKHIEDIGKKFPDGITDVNKVDESSRTYLLNRIKYIREISKKIKYPEKPDWFEPIRVSRNTEAHSTDELSDVEFSQICNSFFTYLPSIKKDSEKLINSYKQKNKVKNKFEKYASPEIGTEKERKLIVDAIQDKFTPVDPQFDSLLFPETKYGYIAKDLMNEITQKSNVKDYAAEHEGFCTNIQTDVLEFLKSVQFELSSKNPFIDEEAYINSYKKLNTKEFVFGLTQEESNLGKKYRELKTVKTAAENNLVDFDFYINQLEQLENSTDEEIQKDKENRQKILQRNLLQDLEKNLYDKKTKWELAEIDELRKAFLKQLYEKIENFMKLEKLISPFQKKFGRLWDLSEGLFEESGFEILETFAGLLEKDESLQELAELLGKHDKESETYERELRELVVTKSKWVPKNAWKGEIKGLKYSNDISAVLPAELAMANNPAAKKMFQLKLAQKQLLSYDYQNQLEMVYSETGQEEAEVLKEEHNGPVIICVDSSGSMSGTPENIAKTITYAIAKIALEQDRKCYLISFSTGIETRDLTPAKKQYFSKEERKRSSLQQLIDFLKMSFNGGTDAAPALMEALKQLKGNGVDEGYKNADVLVVSDFVMDGLGSKVEASIEEEKGKDTNFYSLLIGNSENTNVIKCFNHNWVYNLNDKHAARHLVEQLHQLGK